MLWFGSARSPRRLVRSVNDLVALYRQHGDAHVPLRAQAAFLISPGSLKADEADRERRQTALDIDDWLAAAASLTYGLPPAAALEVHVADRVSEAIDTGDRTAVVDVAQDHGQAVLRVVERKAYDLARGRAPQILDRLAWLLGGLPESPETDRAWRHLLRHAPAVETWEDVGTEPDAGRGVGLMLHRAAGSPHVLLALLRALNTALTDPKERGRVLSSQKVDGDGDPVPDTLYPSDEDVQRWAVVATTAIAEALDAGLDPTTLDYYRVPGFAVAYAQAVRVAAETRPDPRVLQLLRPDDPDAIVAHLERAARAGEGRSDELADTVQALLATDAPWEWSPLLNAVRDRLEDATRNPLLGQALSLGDAYQFTAVLLLLAYDPRSPSRDVAQDVLDWADREGVLGRLAQIARAADREDIVSSFALGGAVALALLLHADASLATGTDEEPEGDTDRVKGQQAAAALLRGDVTGTSGLAQRFGLTGPLRDRLPEAPEVVKGRIRDVLEASTPGLPSADSPHDDAP